MSSQHVVLKVEHAATVDVELQSITFRHSSQVIYQSLAISAGGSETCAVTIGGGVTCWGFGRIVPVAVSELTNKVAQVSVGGYHSCAVMTNGRARCWGSNFNGQLGTGTFVDSATPVDVVDPSNDVSQISGGLFHTCALTTSGDAKCWGYNYDGQLGNGTFSTTYPNYNSATPVDVIGFAHDVAELWDGEPWSSGRVLSDGH